MSIVFEASDLLEESADVVDYHTAGNRKKKISSSRARASVFVLTVMATAISLQSYQEGRPELWKQL